MQLQEIDRRPTEIAEAFRGVFDDDAIARVALEIAQRLPLLYEKNFGQMSSVARRRNE